MQCVLERKKDISTFICLGLISKIFTYLKGKLGAVRVLMLAVVLLGSFQQAAGDKNLLQNHVYVQVTEPTVGIHDDFVSIGNVKLDKSH